MEFSKDLLTNKVYCDQPTMFNPLLKERTEGMTGEEMNTGALLQPNGDILFRIYAPNAKTVEMKVRGQADCTAGCSFTRGEDGIFEGLYPYDPTFCGPHSIDIIVDGMVVIYPFIPVMWHRNKPVNFIEVPDPETPYIGIYDVPHGSFTREIYWSEALQTWERCMVYTPPGYQKTTEDYPVLYLQHGNTENETCWEYNGRVGYIMDNQIAAGKVKPFIIVMNDGMVRAPGADQRDHSAFEHTLTESCIPFIEKTYRVKTDKWSRAIAGLSMGSAQAFTFGMKHPELFGWIGCFSGSMNMRGNNTELLKQVMKKEYFAENYKLFFRSVGDAEPGLQRLYDEGKMLDESGVRSLGICVDKIYPYQTHEWGCWRRAIHDFAELVFKEQ